jgi:hypothetical protein
MTETASLPTHSMRIQTRRSRLCITLYARLASLPDQTAGPVTMNDQPFGEMQC